MDFHSKYTDPVFLIGLDNLELAAKCSVDGFFSGGHVSPHKGFSLEYREHRDYYPGDDPKYIDWKAFARSDRLYVKQSTRQTNTNIYLLLDTSASMNYSSDRITKLEYGFLLCSALSYLALKQNDSINLILFAEKILKNISISKRHQLSLLFKEFENIQGTDATDFPGSLHAFAEKATRRGVVIIISDLHGDLDQIKRAFSHIKSRKHDVIIFHTLDIQEIEFDFRGLIKFEDIETGVNKNVYSDSVRRKYLKNFRKFVNETKKFCGLSNIDYLMMDTCESLDNCLRTYLKNRMS
jgi:uncharacterized protein (DUF58 family)